MSASLCWELPADDVAAMPTSTALAHLTALREDPAPPCAASFVAACGESLGKKGALRADLDAAEQVGVAATQCGNLPLAQRCVAVLNRAFPAASRTLRLRALVAALAGDATLARQLVASSSAADPQTSMHEAALLRGELDRDGALAALEDAASLGHEPHACVAMFHTAMLLPPSPPPTSPAAACEAALPFLERAFASDPHTHALMLVYAEALLTAKPRAADARVARRYFVAVAAASVPSDGGAMRSAYALRALWGALLAGAAARPATADDRRVAEWAAGHISAIYAAAGAAASEMLSVVAAAVAATIA